MSSLLSAVLPSEEMVMIVDMEAGLEHLSLKTTSPADVMLVVIEPFHQSMETGRYAYQMAIEMGIPRVFVVPNQISSPVEAGRMEAFCQARGLQIIGTVPFDETVREASQIPRAPLDYCPQSPAVVEITRIGQELLKAIPRHS